MDGVRADLGTRKQRALLAALVLHRPRVVSVDALLDLLWGNEPPAAVTTSLHGYVAGLRRALEPGRAARTPASVLVTVPPGYVLRLTDEQVDVSRFATAVAEAHRALARPDDPPLPAVPDHLGPAELADVAQRLAEALELWRGTPYQDLEESGAAVAERARLAELRLVAVEDRALVRMRLGESATVVAELEAQAALHPLRERLWALWAMALARAGRQADAAAVLRTVRRTLASELGVRPGAVLRAVESAMRGAETGPPARGPAAAPPGAAVGPVEPSVEPPGDPRLWTLVGRDGELAELTGLLGLARQGTAQFAQLVGEPGVGKSRLVEELAVRAGVAGFTVLTGGCSQDEGAPPFWPWAAVLAQLVASLGEAAVVELVGGDGPLLTDLLPAPAAVPVTSPRSPSVEAERFCISDAVRRLLEAASARRALLVVLDDLHWADPSSLRLLHHLAETVTRARLVVVTTRRQHPEPAGVLAEVGVALARRHALRLTLTGLPPDGVAALVRRVTGRDATSRQVEALRERTGGNPFFLVELLRLLAREGGPELRLSGEIPAAVSDVVARRVGRLPQSTQDLLRTAAVLGGCSEARLLAAVARRDENALLDDLDPAVAAGIVVEEPEVGWFRFSHAIVRDVLYQELSPTRRARRHAAVAATLTEDGDERMAEAAAWHWLAAGPAHAATAWRAAARAAGQARRRHGHEEAAELLGAAVAAQAGDRACGPVDRYDLLVVRAAACHWVGDREGQLNALDQAVREADALGDTERLARAAVSAADGAVWTIRDLGRVHEPAVAALRRSLRELPAGDSDLRCRVLLTLSGELHFSDVPGERDALAEDGLAMARRIGDPGLLAWAAATAFVATWQAGHVESRWKMVGEALTAITSRPDEVLRTRLLTYRAIAAMETGRIPVLWHDLTEARVQAERLRLPYQLLVLNSMELPWRAMQGRFDRAAELVTEADDLVARTLAPARPFVGVYSRLFLRVWQGRASECLDALRALHSLAPTVTASMLLLALVHAGAREEARGLVESGGYVLDGQSWTATFNLAVAAHAAYLIGAPAFAAEVYDLLAPHAGRPASAGTSATIGPVDAYLALAAAATGERALAARHADAAGVLASEWEIPVMGRWLTRLRDAAGF